MQFASFPSRQLLQLEYKEVVWFFLCTCACVLSGVVFLSDVHIEMRVFFRMGRWRTSSTTTRGHPCTLVTDGWTIVATEGGTQKVRGPTFLPRCSQC